MERNIIKSVKTKKHQNFEKIYPFFIIGCWKSVQKTSLYAFILFNICTIFQALFCIDRSLSVALASRTLKVSRAEVLAYLGRYGEAQEIANDLLRMDNMNADAIYVRGLCLYYEDSVDKVGVFYLFKY